jgi:hypothetical protein
MIDFVGEQTRIGPASMEHGHLMAVLHRQLHRMPTYERRPTNEQQPHNTSPLESQPVNLPQNRGGMRYEE